MAGTTTQQAIAVAAAPVGFGIENAGDKLILGGNAYCVLFETSDGFEFLLRRSVKTFLKSACSRRASQSLSFCKYPSSDHPSLTAACKCEIAAAVNRCTWDSSIPNAKGMQKGTFCFSRKVECPLFLPGFNKGHSGPKEMN